YAYIGDHISLRVLYYLHTRRRNRHSANNNIHGAISQRARTVRGLQETKIHTVAVAKDVFGDFVRDLDFKTTQLTGGSITVGQQTMRLIHANNQPAALNDIGHALLRGYIIRAVSTAQY